MPRQPDDRHVRPEGLDDATLEAVGKASEAYEWIVRARGRLYDFHQMMGRADILLGEAVERLEQAGQIGLAGQIRSEYLGRNAILDQWTFEIIEDFDETFFAVAERWDRRLRDELLEGRRHVFEAEMKARRRADGPTDDTG